MTYFFTWLERLPLRWRLALLSFGLLTILMATFSTVISLSQEQTLLRAQADVLHARSQNISKDEDVALSKISDAANNAIHLTNIENLYAAAKIMSSEQATDHIKNIQTAIGKDIGITFLSFEGEVLANDPFVPVTRLDPAQVHHWLETKEQYILAQDSQGRRNLVILHPYLIMVKSENPGSSEENAGNKVYLDPINKNEGIYLEKALIQLSIPTTVIDQSIASTRLIMGLVFGGILLIGAVLTFPLIGRALRPLSEIERASGRIAAGELSLRLKEPLAHDEVGRLAHSFNYMVARLERTFTRQKQFVGDVSHELRTPLTALGGSLEMLLLEANNGDAEAARRLMRGMYGEVERLQRLVADLLILSRLDEGQIPLRKEPVMLEKLAQEVCEQAQHLTDGQEISCRVIPMPVVYGNADQLRRVLLNVIENGIKFTPAPGYIKLTMQHKERAWIVIEVQDTGIGIPPEALPHVFDRFYRADSSRTRACMQGGSGLGLSIAQSILHAHGGTITLESEPGRGTTVVITLPVSR